MRPVCFSIRLSTQMSGLTCVLSLYVIRSNSPSGGMNEMVRSFSNRASRTHWWNLMSSRSTDLPCRTHWCARESAFFKCVACVVYGVMSTVRLCEHVCKSARVRQ